MKQYRVSVQWLERNRLGDSGLKTYCAADLQDACRQALARYGHKVCAGVSCAWLVWPVINCKE